MTRSDPQSPTRVAQVAQLAPPTTRRTAQPQRVQDHRGRNWPRRRERRSPSPEWATGGLLLYQTRPGGRTRSLPGWDHATKTTPTWRLSTPGLFVDTLKGATSVRARRRVEAVEPLDRIIDPAVAQASLQTASTADASHPDFGGAGFERTFYCAADRPSAPPRAYQRAAAGPRPAAIHTRHEMLDLVMIDGDLRSVAPLCNVAIEAHPAGRGGPVEGGDCNVSTLDQRQEMQRHRDLAPHKRVAGSPTACFPDHRPASRESGEYSRS